MDVLSVRSATHTCNCVMLSWGWMLRSCVQLMTYLFLSWANLYLYFKYEIIAYFLLTIANTWYYITIMRAYNSLSSYFMSNNCPDFYKRYCVNISIPPSCIWFPNWMLKVQYNAHVVTETRYCFRWLPLYVYLNHKTFL